MSEIEQPFIHWIEDDQPRPVRWCSESANAVPKGVLIADDRMTANTAYRLACEGTGMLWSGDFQNALQLLLQALARRASIRPRRFNLQRARTLGMLLPFEVEITVSRCVVRPMCSRLAAKPMASPVSRLWVSLRELLGMIGAHE